MLPAAREKQTLQCSTAAACRLPACMVDANQAGYGRQGAACYVELFTQQLAASSRFNKQALIFVFGAVYFFCVK